MDARTMLKEMPVFLVDPDNPNTVVEVWEPLGLFGRARGLLGTTSVGRGRGFLLRAKQVHTIGMVYPIDVIHISRKGVVVRVQTMQPGRIGHFTVRARWTLEMDIGEAERLGIKVGGRLVRQP